MKKKIVYMFLALVVVVAGVVTYTTTAKAEKTEKRIKTIVERVNALYADETQDFLISDINEKSFKMIDELIEAEEGTKLTEELAGKLNTAIMNVSTAKQMYEAETAVNNLLDESGVLNIDIDIDINNVIEKVSDLEGIKPAFAEAQRETINIASEQQAVIIETMEKINLLFNEDGTVKEEVTRVELEEIQLLHAEVRQVTTREALQAKLIAIDEKVVAKEVAAEEARLEEEARRVEEARKAEEARAQANNNTNNATASKGSQSSSNSSASNSNSSSSGNNGSNNKSGNNSSSGSSSSSKPSSSGGSSSGNSSSDGSSSVGSGWDKYNPGDSWNCEITGGGIINGGNGNTWLGGTCGPMQ